VAKEVAILAKEEHRTKSELFREMVRVYRRYRTQRERDEERWVTNLIQEAKAEQAQYPMSTKAMLADDDRLGRYGAQKAKKLGIKPGDINRIIHERRKSRKS
jgi:hypothetical protein